jgi:hypothetical protein
MSAVSARPDIAAYDPKRPSVNRSSLQFTRHQRCRKAFPIDPIDGAANKPFVVVDCTVCIEIQMSTSELIYNRARRSAIPTCANMEILMAKRVATKKKTGPGKKVASSKKTGAKRLRREYTKSDVRDLKSHSKARTPVAKIAKLMKRTEASLRQKALTLKISLGHRR